jgi:hypothetical protein
MLSDRTRESTAVASPDGPLAVRTDRGRVQQQTAATCPAPDGINTRTVRPPYAQPILGEALRRSPQGVGHVQQRSTAATALSSTFGFVQMRPGQRKQGYKRLLRGVRDEVLSDQLSDYDGDIGRASGMLHTEEVTGSNPVSPTKKASQRHCH